MEVFSFMLRVAETARTRFLMSFLEYFALETSQRDSEVSDEQIKHEKYRFYYWVETNIYIYT